MSSPKRQKITHQASSPSSGISTDELDSQVPENVVFGPSQRSNQAVSIQSFNSQGSGLQARRRGSTTGLTEHRNVERMMNSTAPTKKQRRRDANRDQHSKLEPPSSTALSSPSQLIDISSQDEGEGKSPRPESVYQVSSSETREQPSAILKSPKAKTSTKPLDPSTGHRSPYFQNPQLPSNQENSVPKQQKNHTEDLVCKYKRSERLGNQFVTTDGTRRSLDFNMSSDADELQMGTTVGNNADSHVLSLVRQSNNRSPSKSAPSTLAAPSSVMKDPGLTPSIIKHSEFRSLEPKTRHDSFSGPPGREKKAPWAVDVASVNLPGHLETRTGMGLVHDEHMKSFVLKAAGTDTGIRVIPQKLQKIWWENSGKKIRFMSSKIGTEENIVELELQKEKQVFDLVSRIGPLVGCNMIPTSRCVPVQVFRSILCRLTNHSERMEKMFEKRRSDYREAMALSQPNRSYPAETTSSEVGEQPRETTKGRTSTTEKAKSGPRKQSIVDKLFARAIPENPVENTRPIIKPIPNGLPRGESISEQLERLKPKHNQHLRRSTRTSSEFKVPYQDHLDDLGEAPTVERYSKTHDLGEPWKRPLIYPKSGRKKITIEFTDLERLDEGQYLNDNLLSFYLRFLEYSLEQERPDLAKRVYFFNTFFFATLMNTHKGRKGFNYEGVQKWTRNVDLFTYDYIVVPINEAAHWYLAIICNLPALARNVSMDDGSPSLSATTPNIVDPVGLSAPSSSPTIDPSLGEPLDTLGSKKDSGEREARDSFAEMSLDADASLPSKDAITLHENPKLAKNDLVDEDQEMLDRTSQGAISPKTDDAEIERDCLEGNVKEAGADKDQGPRAVAKSRKGKRKSGPPAVTRTPPDKPVIMTFDSLGVARSSTVRILKDYLREEAKAKRSGLEFESGQIKGITASQIPQQDNFYDCGVFLLGYVAKFLEDDPKKFIAKIIKREYDEKKDWPNLKPSTLRNSMRDQVMKLHNDQVTERQRERDAQKNEKQDVEPEKKSFPMLPAAVNQVKEPDHEPHLTKTESAQASAKAKSSTQPATRKDALINAVALGADDLNLDVHRHVQDHLSDQKPEASIWRAEEEPKDQEAKLKNTKRKAAGHENGKQTLPDSLDKKTPVVLIESQSQGDGSAPRSFIGSHQIPSAYYDTHKSPELPAEIQDSQPSQTSRVFEEIVRKASDKDESADFNQKERLQDTPIVQLEDPREAKRRKTGKAADVADNDEIHGIYTETNQTNTTSKRKRSDRKIQKSDEVINIDD